MQRRREHHAHHGHRLERRIDIAANAALALPALDLPAQHRQQALLQSAHRLGPFAPAPPQLRHEDAPESGVAENSRGERIHHGRKGFHGRRSLTGDSHKVVDDLANALHEDAGGDIGLAGEVVVGHALRNARHLHDALHRRVGVAAFGNDLDRRIQQLAPGGVRLARSPLLLGHAPPSRPRNRQCRVQNASTGSAPSGNHSFWSSQRSCGH